MNYAKVSIIKQEIERLPEVHTDFCTYDFDKTSNNHTVNSKLIELLTEFKYSEYFEESLQIAFYYLEHNTEYPMDFYFFFGDKLGFDRESYKCGFAQERLLIEKLTVYYEEKRTTESALCLTFCISNCLKYNFSNAESTRNNTVTIFQFGLPNCEEVFEIRFLCFQALSVLFSDAEYRKLAIRTLLSYSGYLETETDKVILEQDMIAFTTCFAELLDMNNFAHCTIIHHFQTICERYGVAYPDMLLTFKDNRIFMLYLSMKDDRTLIYETWEEAERKRKQEIYELCQVTTDEEFENLWIALEDYNLEQHDRWDISTGIDMVFKSLANNPDRFLRIVNFYIQHGTPFGNRSQFTFFITSKLIEMWGYDAAIEFIGAKEFDDKEKWLAHIYGSIPESKIEEKTPEFFMEKLVKQKDEDTVYTLSLNTVLKINSLHPGFLVRYIETMNEMCDKHAWVISAFMDQIDMQQGNEFVNYFTNHLDLLESTYLNALRGRQYFDYHGQLLVQIVKRDIGFISTVVKFTLADGYSHRNHENLNILWDDDNYQEYISVAMDAIKENSEGFYGYDSLSEKLMAYKKGDTERRARQEKWISDYIIKNNADADSMEFIFKIIRNLSNERRKDSILLFCKHNCSYSDFRVIPLLPSHMSWSGSEVPMLEKQITFLEDIKNSLQGFVYIEHRAYLAERIQFIHERKEKVLLQEFIDAR